MRFLLAALGLFGLAAAAASAVCPGNNHNDTINNLSTARGLKLRVRLRDPRADLASPVQHQYISSIHDGAGTNLVGFRADTGRIFYVNGTDSDKDTSWSTVSDGGAPPVPYGLSLHTLDDDWDVQVARLDVGPGDGGVYVPAVGAAAAAAAAHPQLRPMGWLACNEPLAYYGGKRFNVLRRRGGGRGAMLPLPPEECVAIALLPECAELKELPEGALASHEFAREVSCYRDASKM
ncbi:uncharacterized protein BBA_02669 [Beauveria bassiana ARSEF 2860]|uniref:DUF7907 domain-containing protein n=1 Tax=Beauveria bassiana (strain ARSEF 2860) TaxID=655819 RepID=J4USL3_BEAB2|nr:uncharacterized protein BBA_02669 [Beauveria bassiana ARSEF 2860]EJP68667.1 hypothetical protein BBA_02669 [Beauveria bassiana ARSEF 2860]